MARTRTITDEAILAAARSLFRAQGHEVTTRQLAQAAGISEGVLYQRFTSKDRLFFAAMAPAGPDFDAVLGADTASEDPREYLKGVTVRMADYFGEVLPLAIRLITHPSFDRNSLSHGQPAMVEMQHALVARLSVYEKEKRLRKGSAALTAQLLVRLAHDCALTRVMGGRHGPKHREDIEAMVELLWHGAAPRR